MLGALLLGCAGSPDAASQPAVSDEPGHPDLSWSIVESSGGLQLQWEITNSAQEPRWFCDQLLVKSGENFALTEQVIVKNGAPGEVWLILGMVSSDRPSAVLYPPTFRALQPGESMARTVLLDRPLRAWHPVGGASPIADGADRVRLRVAWFDGEPPTRTTLPAEPPIEVFEGFSTQWLDGGARSLP